jgi:hypothetical protein
MRELYEYAYEKGRRGVPWRTTPRGIEATEMRNGRA